MKECDKILRILEMRQEGYSYRSIQGKLNVGASTIRLASERLEESGFGLAELESKSPEEVMAILHPKAGRRKEIPLPDFEECYHRLRTSGKRISLSFIWYEYKEKHPDGYQFTQFCELFNRYMEENHGGEKAYMPVERIPGERIYIDWVGDTPSILLDNDTGELRDIHILVTTVGYSSYLFAKAYEDEKLPNFLDGVAEAITFYGAISRYLVPDNLKSAVTRHTKDELLLNTSFSDLESFYGTIVLPPPARKPKGKPTVERGVQHIENTLITKLSEETYTSLQAINDRIMNIIEELNGRRKRGENKSRKELFEEFDRPCMRPIPERRFMRCDYAFFSKVPDNYHLRYDDHYYSVPYQMCGQRILLKATASEICICNVDNTEICRHKRAYSRFPKYITEDSHMPQNHRFFASVNSHDGDYYLRWASDRYGKGMQQVINKMLHSQKHEETSYLSCNAVLQLCKSYPVSIVRATAERCLKLNCCSYTGFKRIIAEISNRNPDSGMPGSLPDNPNIRGKEEYR